MTKAKTDRMWHSSQAALATALGLAIALVSALAFLWGIPDTRAQTQPTIVSVSPDTITVGTQNTLTITGSSFEDTPTVTVDAQVLVDVGFVSTTTLTATVSPGLPVGVYTVTVTNPGGLSDSLLEGLTVQNSAPTLAALTPDSGPNNMDTQVVITGTCFVPTPTVTLGDVQVQDVAWISSTRLAALVPWGLQPGTYDLVVANPGPGTPSATLSAAFTVSQAIGTWTTDGPYGGVVQNLAMDEHVTSTLYAGLQLGGWQGFFKSEDGGDNWFNAFPGYMAARASLAGFALKPGAPETIYLSGHTYTQTKLYRSSDGGESWEVIREDGGGGMYASSYAIGVSPGDPGYLYVGRYMHGGTGPRVVLSTDSGDTWQVRDNGIPTDAPVFVVAVHPVTPTVAFAGTESGRVYRTVNAGEDWTEVADLGEGWWHALAIDPHAPQRLYASGWSTGYFFARSLDGGENWETMTLGPGELSASDIKFHPTISGTMYAIASAGIYSSTDAGASWGWIPIASEWREGSCLLVNPQTGVPFYIGHNGRGVLRSDDGGFNWEVRSNGLAGLRPDEIATSPADPRYIYVGADEGGGFVSNNGGQSWLAADGVSLDRGISVAVHPYTPTVAYLGARRAVYKTIDGGQSWVRHELPGLPPNNEMRVHAIAIDPDDPRVVYAGPGTWDFTGGPEYGWLFRSLDGGESWNPLTITLPISAVTDIEIDPTDSQTIYVATGRRFLASTDHGTGVLKTSDGGESWAFVNEGLTCRSVTRLAINPEDPQILYAGAALEENTAESGVYRTADGGEHWEQVIGGLQVSGLAIDPLVTTTVYVGAYGSGLFRSTDDGAHWEREGGSFGRLSSECLHVTAAPSRTIIFAGVAGGLIIAETAAATDGTSTLTGPSQLYGGGVYQLTIDRRPLRDHVYLPLVLRN